MTDAAERERASWFAVDVHVPDRTFGMLDIGLPVVERSTFLDNRIEAPWQHARQVPVDAFSGLPVPDRLGWLFHTSFCCSTLLARALHVGPAQVVLREPLVLRRLGDARRAGWPVDEFVAPAVALLGRPWEPGGSVIVKPTHAALGLASALLAASAAPAIFLTSSLDDFLVSNIKKTRETQARIPELAERALSASQFGRLLPPAALAPPDLLAAAALQWAAQRMIGVELTRSDMGSRIRWLEAAQLLSDPERAVLAAARWLGTAVDESHLRQRARDEGSRHAKAVSRPYGPEVRALEAAAIRERYDGELKAALAWFARHVEPHLPDDVLAMPGLEGVPAAVLSPA